MYKFMVAVCEGGKVLGDVEVNFNPRSTNRKLSENLKERIQISHFSAPSDRCPPLAVLHTITSPSTGVCLKMKCPHISSSNSPLNLLHSSCLRENKTAVVSLGGEELHLVAMRSRQNGICPCFWGFNIAPGLYESCLIMLNIRCLGIVFDLDETLIVANTMRSFEDRIEALQRRVSYEVDPRRVAGMLAEIKRYQDDRNMLKQYAESDQIVDNGKVIKSQSEAVPALSDTHQPLVRPLIRLPEKNIILTRINPQIRDTSVLVRLRPAWEDLRSYLTAKGRKRFEVFVCTMAERDYALEMWRLLDPDLKLINTKELLKRIVCVKSGLKKSLFNVFQDGNCHPHMALVIDDRMEVWDEKDQPRVHEVPAFSPYYAPQAEANSTLPILCLARNVACNVRGSFFKDFDDGLLQRIAGIAHEDEFEDILPPPDVANYLITEDDASAINGDKEPLGFEGMAGVEVERRFKDAMTPATVLPVIPSADPRLNRAFQYNTIPAPMPIVPPTMPYPNKQLPLTKVLPRPLTQVNLPETNLHNSPAREEGEVPESELDPDTRRRLLILQHGMDTRDNSSSEPQFPVRPPMPVSVPQVQSRGGWFPGAEDMNPRHLNRVTPPKEFPLHREPMTMDMQHPLHVPPFLPKEETPMPPDRVLLESRRLPNEGFQRDDRLRLNHAPPSYSPFPGEEDSLGQSYSDNRDLDIEAGNDDPFSESPVGYLQHVAFKCGTIVQFKHTLVHGMELRFFVEAWFVGEKIGEGTGRTRGEAQLRAAEASLMNLSDNYRYRLSASSDHKDGDRFNANANTNVFTSDVNSFGHQPSQREGHMAFSTASEPVSVMDPRMEVPTKGSVVALQELCTIEGLSLAFQLRPPPPDMDESDDVYVQVEIDGDVWGKGVGSTWDEAKMQAAENAYLSLKAKMAQNPQKRPASPRSFQESPSKRFRPEFPRSQQQRMPSSARYPRNSSPVP